MLFINESKNPDIFFLTVISESLSEPSLPSSGRARYSSTSSLSSAATASSPCAAGIPVSKLYQKKIYEQKKNIF